MTLTVTFHKHLLGQHDQKTHGRRGNSVGGLGSTEPTNQDERDLKDFMVLVGGIRRGAHAPKDLKYASHEDVVFDKGKFYPPPGSAKLPKDVDKGKLKECYLNAIRNMHDGKYWYTEGFAMAKGVPFAVEHAWLTDRDGKVIDPTWSDGGGVAYYGIRFNPNFVRKTILRTEMAGVLANDYLDDNRIIKNGLPKGAIDE